MSIAKRGLVSLLCVDWVLGLPSLAQHQMDCVELVVRELRAGTTTCSANVACRRPRSHVLLFATLASHHDCLPIGGEHDPVHQAVFLDDTSHGSRRVKGQPGGCQSVVTTRTESEFVPLCR